MTPEFLFNLADYSGININKFLILGSTYHKEDEPVKRTSMDVERQGLIQLIRNMIVKIEYLELQVIFLKERVNERRR